MWGEEGRGRGRGCVHPVRGQAVGGSLRKRWTGLGPLERGGEERRFFGPYPDAALRGPGSWLGGEGCFSGLTVKAHRLSGGAAPCALGAFRQMRGWRGLCPRTC